MNDKLPIGDALRFGWEAVKKNLGFLLALGGLVLLIEIGAWIFVGFISRGYPNFGQILEALLQFVSNAIVPTGIAAVSLKLCDSQKPAFGDFLCDGRTLLFYFLASLLYGIVVMAGIVLLILPGIYVAVRMGQYGYFVVEQKTDPIEAVKKSWEATRGKFWNLIVFGFALFALNIAGFLALFVGLAVTVPISMVASAYIYRVLSHRLLSPQTPQKDPSTPPPILVQSTS